ncbi:unnamed protein product [Ectocarpus sp. CCAP 1310/34]|nr:unnamed protein product [Ectocarpus sp. CCAP 1310/34]
MHKSDGPSAVPVDNIRHKPRAK